MVVDSRVVHRAAGTRPAGKDFVDSRQAAGTRQVVDSRQAVRTHLVADRHLAADSHLVAGSRLIDSHPADQIVQVD